MQVKWSYKRGPQSTGQLVGVVSSDNIFRDHPLVVVKYQDNDGTSVLKKISPDVVKNYDDVLQYMEDAIERGDVIEVEDFRHNYALAEHKDIVKEKHIETKEDNKTSKNESSKDVQETEFNYDPSLEGVNEEGELILLGDIDPETVFFVTKLENSEWHGLNAFGYPLTDGYSKKSELFDQEGIDDRAKKNVGCSDESSTYIVIPEDISEEGITKEAVEDALN